MTILGPAAAAVVVMAVVVVVRLYASGWAKARHLQRAHGAHSDSGHVDATRPVTGWRRNGRDRGVEPRPGSGLWPRSRHVWRRLQGSHADDDVSRACSGGKASERANG